MNPTTASAASPAAPAVAAEAAIKMPAEPASTPAQEPSTSAVKLAAGLESLRSKLVAVLQQPEAAVELMAVLPDDADEAGVDDLDLLEAVATCPDALVPCAEGLGAATDDAESDSGGGEPDSAGLLGEPVSDDTAAADNISGSDFGRTDSHRSLRIMQKRAARELALQQESAALGASATIASTVDPEAASLRTRADAALAASSSAPSGPPGEKRRGRPPTRKKDNALAAGGKRVRISLTSSSAAAVVPAAAESAGLEDDASGSDTGCPLSPTAGAAESAEGAPAASGSGPDDERTV